MPGNKSEVCDDVCFLNGMASASARRNSLAKAVAFENKVVNIAKTAT